jgi:hypothetical protein
VKRHEVSRRIDRATTRRRDDGGDRASMGMRPARFLIVGLTSLLVTLLLSRSAFAAPVVTINAPAAAAVVGDSVPVSATVTSVYLLSTVHAQAGAAGVDLVCVNNTCTGALDLPSPLTGRGRDRFARQDVDSRTARQARSSRIYPTCVHSEGGPHATTGTRGRSFRAPMAARPRCSSVCPCTSETVVSTSTWATVSIPSTECAGAAKS